MLGTYKYLIRIAYYYYFHRELSDIFPLLHLYTNGYFLSYSTLNNHSLNILMFLLCARNIS